jgi:hypothetical protein
LQPSSPGLDLSGVNASLGPPSTSRVSGATARWRQPSLRQPSAALPSVSLERMRATLSAHASPGKVLQRRLPPGGKALVPVACRPAVSTQRAGPSATTRTVSPLSPASQAPQAVRRGAVALRGPSGGAGRKKNLLRPPRLLCALCPRSAQPLSTLLRAVVPQGVASRAGAGGALAAAPSCGRRRAVLCPTARPVKCVRGIGAGARRFLQPHASTLTAGTDGFPKKEREEAFSCFCVPDVGEPRHGSL